MGARLASLAAGRHPHLEAAGFAAPFHGASVASNLFSDYKAAPVYQVLTKCQHRAKHSTRVISLNLPRPQEPSLLGHGPRRATVPRWLAARELVTGKLSFIQSP